MHVSARTKSGMCLLIHSAARPIYDVIRWPDSKFSQPQIPEYMLCLPTCLPANTGLVNNFEHKNVLYFKAVVTDIQWLRVRAQHPLSLTSKSATRDPGLIAISMVAS
jgi:hypothetical protein